MKDMKGMKVFRKEFFMPLHALHVSL